MLLYIMRMMHYKNCRWFRPAPRHRSSTPNLFSARRAIVPGTMLEPEFIERFERAVYLVLLLLLIVLIVASVLSLIATLAADLASPPYLLLTGDEILTLFGEFLLVLITLEFFASIRVYLRESAIPYELVVVVAITAIARKIIVLEIETSSDLHMVGLGLVVISLAGAYYLLKRGGIAGRAQT